MRYTSPRIIATTPADLTIQSTMQKGSPVTIDASDHNLSFNPAYEADE